MCMHLCTQSAAWSEELAELASACDWVLSRKQLAATGIGAAAVASQVRARRWRLLGRHAVVLHRGPLLTAHLWRAAVINAGDLALLTGRSALASYGLTGWEDGRSYVLVPKGARAPAGAETRLLRTRRWPADRLKAEKGRRLPRCSVPRATIDAALMLPSPRAAVGIVSAVVQQRLATADHIAGELAAAGRIRHSKVIRIALGDIGTGSHSVAELDFLALCRRHHLPEPERQVCRRDKDGKVRYLDVVWRLPDGRMVIVEIDGSLHLGQQTYWMDMRRDNMHSLRGDVRLRFPLFALHVDQAGIVEQLREALAPLLAA